MFEDYTTGQLIELRNLCADLAEQSSDIEEAADAVTIVECIDQELVLREREKSA